MKISTLTSILFLVLCYLMFPQQAKAQTAYGISAIQYQSSSDLVVGYSATELDYYAGYYYDPYVEGYLYQSNTNVDYGTSLGYASYYPAQVDTWVSAVAVTPYTLISDHYVVGYYYYYDYYGNVSYYDPFGYSYFSGGSYGGGYNFFGPGPSTYSYYQFFYLGSTGVQITTPACNGNSAEIFDPLIGSCVLPPKLVGPDDVTRTNPATFTLQSTTGATISDWKFTDGSNTVTRTSSPSATTWTGTIVASGRVTVTVRKDGNNYFLFKDITVNDRTNFALAALPATKVANGTTVGTIVLTVPEVPTGSGDNAIGRYALLLSTNMQTTQLGGDGPNTGYKYVSSVTATANATYSYVISPALENTSSAFYQAQCGNYNPQTNTGFISGANLLANTIRHEAGSVQSHYKNYLDAINDATKNPGVILEKLVQGPPGGNAQDFNNNVVTPQFNSAAQVILNAAGVEPCNASDVTLNASCQKSGNINFAPYQACTAPTPTPTPTPVPTPTPPPPGGCRPAGPAGKGTSRPIDPIDPC